MTVRRAQGVTWLLALCAGCAADGVTPPPAPPVVVASAAATNPNNVLSAVVSATTRLADSVAVRVALAGSGEEIDTPAVSVVSDAVTVPVLGLRPDTRYVLRAVAYGRDQSAAGDAIDFTTGSLPSDLPRYVASGSDPLPGFVAFSAGRYGLVIDNAGQVIWYRRFANGPGLNFQPEPTGRYVARPPDADPAAPFMEIDPLGNVTRAPGCAHGLVNRFHDLHEDADGGYWIMCDDTRTMDLSDLGGVASARVTGTVVQHLSAAGELLFEWNAFDHFQITDLAAADRGGATVNWTHGNALDLDYDGNLVVSFRSLSEITKIDVRTGAVMWRMGGLRNEFTFQDAPSPAFLHQHGVRMTAPGEITLLDNLGEPGASRGERYAIDVGRRTARQIASYGSVPPVVAQLGGSTQQLPGGRTLVAFGDGRRVEEYDAAGNVVWRIEGDAGYVFRAQRILSLYRPGVWPSR
jgi:hypothetical protein